MDEITKDEFLENFGSEFVGDEKRGYDYQGFEIPAAQLKDITKQAYSTLDEIETMLKDPENYGDELTDLNNTLMAFIFGDGDEFQGSYEEESGSGDYCWYLDFGNIQIDKENKCLRYVGVRFYKD